jgi:hypothetical protein
MFFTAHSPSGFAYSPPISPTKLHDKTNTFPIQFKSFVFRIGSSPFGGRRRQMAKSVTDLVAEQKMAASSGAEQERLAECRQRLARSIRDIRRIRHFFADNPTSQIPKNMQRIGPLPRCGCFPRSSGGGQHFRQSNADGRGQRFRQPGLILALAGTPTATARRPEEGQQHKEGKERKERTKETNCVPMPNLAAFPFCSGTKYLSTRSVGSPVDALKSCQPGPNGDSGGFPGSTTIGRQSAVLSLDPAEENIHRRRRRPNFCAQHRFEVRKRE